MYDVITIGSAVVDTFVDTGNRLFQDVHRGCVRVPFGSKILIENVRVDTGGAGTNTATVFSRLGFKAACVSKAGCGTNSQRIINALKKEHVDTSLIICSPKGRTGFSIILDAKGHDRTILAFKGSNDDLRYNEVKKSKLKTKWFYIGSMLNESYKTVEKLADFAVRNNIKTAFNPSAYLAEKGVGFLGKLLRNIDVLILNKEEAGYIAGKSEDIAVLLKKLKKLIAGIVVITDGKKGAYCYDGKYSYHIAAHHIKVVEATGAGDAFAASFVAGLMKGKSIEFCLQLGIANSESVITHPGAKNKLLHWKEIVEMINKNPGKITKQKQSH
ncbi:MAG: carbohydrate kinase family protein [Candidatus Woesearchaeota archaeon]|nr:carbohydrate kinase family protein [Candidatus Woesearchaeota archaeon]